MKKLIKSLYRSIIDIIRRRIP